MVRRRRKLPDIIKLSELLAIGVKYFRPDSTTFMEFNDGTRLWWYYWNDDNDGYTDMSGLEFWCERNGKTHWVEDDISHFLPKESPLLIHNPPKTKSNFFWRDPGDFPPRATTGDSRSD